VSPTFLDPNDPFAAPFSIVNQGRWFTFYNMHPGCIPNVHTNQRNYVGIIAEGAISQAPKQGGQIRAGDTLQFKCPIVAAGMRPDKLNIVITGSYDIHLIPYVFQFTRSFRSEPIQWWFDSQGNPHWLVGEQLK
jgi:hypothetical protein